MIVKLRLKAVTDLDEWIMILFMLQVLIIPWISSDLSNLLNYVLVMLTAISLIQYRKFFSTVCFAIFLIFIIYQLFNYSVLGGNLYYLLRNWFRTFKSMMIIIYITNLIREKPHFLPTFFGRWSNVFNIYAIVNIPFLLSQLTHNFRTTTLDSLMGKITYRGALYYSKDMMSGLFGLYGTPRLAMFVTFLLIYNFVRNYKNGQRKSRVWDMFNIILFIFYLWMATQNDNKGFYIILLLFALSLHFAFNEEKMQKRFSFANFSYQRMLAVFNAGLILMFVLIVTVFIYNTVDSFKGVIDMAILKIQEGFLLGTYSDYTSVDGGGERFAMILYALSRPQSAFIGHGLGNYVYTSGNLGFAHFGQADVGTFICLGGSIYILLMFTVIYQGFKRNFSNAFLPKILLTVFIILSCYTHVMMDTSITITIMMIYTVCWYVAQGRLIISKKQEKTNENWNCNMF